VSRVPASRRHHNTKRAFDLVRFAGPAAATLALCAALAGCGGDDDVRPPLPGGGRVWRVTPDGVGADCPTPADCIASAAPGDTIEFAGGIYAAVSDTLVDDGLGGLVTAVLVVDRSLVLTAAPGTDVRIDGQWQPGRIGLSIPAGDDTVVVRGLRFDNCDAGLRAVGTTVVVEKCEFVAGLRGLVADETELVVRDSRFSEYGGEALLIRKTSGRVEDSEFWGNNYGPYVAESRDFAFENTLVAFCCLTGMRLEEGGTTRLTNVTLTGAGMVPDDSTGIVVAGGSHLVLTRGVVAGNRGYGIHCRAGGTAEVSCSDLFANSSGNYAGMTDPTGTAGNLAVDPLFCSMPDLDFHLREESPLRAAACGAMGAFAGEGCRPLSPGPRFAAWFPAPGR
jgi:hypothetical protein